MSKKNILQIAGKIKSSMVNGDGIRYTLFLSGCPFHCKGCHSPHTQDYNYGDKEDIKDIFKEIYERRNFISGVSISGGEPTEQSVTLLELLKLLKKHKINIWLWTGHLFKDLKKLYPELLDYLDIVIDGRYEQDKPTKKTYCGSDNQIKWVKKGKIWENDK